MKQQQRNWLTTGQAAQLCAVTPATVLSWIRKGRLEGARTAGGHYRIKRENLQHLLVEEGSSPEGDGFQDGQSIKPLRCWEYLNDGNTLKEECSSCVAYRTRTAWCFLLAGKESGSSEIGHLCPNSCGECVYYRRVVGLPTRVLVISTDQGLIERLESRIPQNLALRFAGSAYEASAIAQSFPPAFAVIDGESFPINDNGGLIENLAQDPRLPGLKIIVAIPGDADPLPAFKNNRHVEAQKIDRSFGLDQINAVVESYPVESGSLDELAALGLNLEGEAAMVTQKHGSVLENEVNDDGFLNDLARWDRAAAEELAEEHNIGPLTEDHWKVIDFVQEHYQTYGRGPEVVKIHKVTGLTTTDICKLFPCGMVKGAYRLAGLPRPPGCG